MADYTTLKAAIASVIKTNGNQEITGLLLQQTLHSMLDGVNTTKQDTINFVINTANKFLRDDGTFQEIQSPAGGFANNLYFTDIDSVVVSGYKTLSYNPDAGTINLNASVTSAEGVKTVQNYLYPSGVSVDLFPSGLWSFNFYAYLDLNVGNTQIGVQYFKRSVAGVETNLFTAWSAEINNKTPLWIKFETTNPSFIVDPTDRMGARILVKTTSMPAVNVTIAIGDGYAAYLNNPNRIRHSQLRDWNGDPNYLHITQAEKTNFQTAFIDRFKWDGGSSGLVASTARESLGLRIGIDVLAYRTFGSAASNNTNDFLAYNGVAVDSSKLGGQLPSYYQTNITAGTSLQYYRGDKTMQTLDTSVVPENSNMYFTYPRVLATALTGYVAGANTALSATDTILAAMGKIQGQINARALASDLSGHINNATIHLTADEKTYLGKIMTYLKVAVDNTSMYSTINFYSESGVSAYGIGTGGGGGAGVDIIDNLLSVRADAALSANQGRILKGFVDLKQPQLNGTGLVRMSGTGVTYDNNSYALASSLSNYSLTSHTHSYITSTRYDSGDPKPNQLTVGLSFQFSLPDGGWYNALNMRSYDDPNYLATQIVSSANNPGSDTGYSFSLKYREGRNATWLGWKTILDSSNYSSYALPLSGGGLTGMLYMSGANYLSLVGLNYNNVATITGNWSGSGHWGFGSESGHILKFDVVSGQTFLGYSDITLKLGTKTVIDSGNIGSQSVNYAVSAGLLNNSVISDENLAVPLNSRVGSYMSTTGTTAIGGDGYITTWTWTGGYYATQLYLDVDPTYSMSIRHRDSGGTWNSWKKIWTEANLTSTLSSGCLPYWNGSSLVNSEIKQYGNNIAIGRESADHKVDLQGNVLFRNSLGNASFYFAQESDNSSTFYHYNNGTLKNVLSSNGYSYIAGSVGIGYTDRNEKFAVNGSGYFNGGLVATADSTIGKNEAVSHRLQILTGASNSAYIYFYPYSMYGFVLGNFNVSGNNQFQLRNNADEVVVWFGNNNDRNAYFNGQITAPTITATTELKIGAGWSAIQNGTSLDLRYGGVMKARLDSSGNITAVGGVTAFAV